MSTSPMSSPRDLRATYRLQLTPEFDFTAARDLVPYLAELGISHLYLSPSLQARAGSTHGYDVADPSQLSNELGGEDAFRAMTAAAHEAGLGVILDVVPNHMAASDENRFWADEDLRRRFFDVDEATGRWRRFFDVDELAAIRIESEEVFTATHTKVISLVAEGLVDGLRVDHPDGLADPQGYLQRLADAGVARVWVEKILGADERLPEGWPVSGTVGYDFLNDLVALCANPAAEAPLTELWEEIAADSRPFGAWALEAKLEQATGTFSPEVDRLARIPGAPGDAAALALALATQPVYRSYVPTSAGEFITRFQQTSPAVMAKGVEDTSFYRYCRLLALNEVGGEPGRFTLSTEAFHAHNAERATQFPEALLTTMTHDAKRSADARARILALTWVLEPWMALVRRWIGWGEGPDPTDRLFILQTLAGVGDIEFDRLDGYLEKALREAKRHSNWISPDEAYEAGAKAWMRAILADEDFRAEFDALLEQVVPIGAQISRAWIALKILAPGVPDIYQGDELAFLALVDPDNRRPVEWDERRRQVSAPEDPKLVLIKDLLALRARRPDAFGPGASYQALEAEPGTVAFSRAGAGGSGVGGSGEGGRGERGGEGGGGGGGAIEVRIGVHPGSGFVMDVREP